MHTFIFWTESGVSRHCNILKLVKICEQIEQTIVQPKEEIVIEKPSEKIDIQSLQVIEYQNERALTTKQVGQAYESKANNIKNNYARNKENFTKDKDFYLLEGAILKEFKIQVNNIHLVDPKSSSLYLWTERGANKHCKLLDTKKAWQQFDVLLNSYFKVKEEAKQTDLINLSPEMQILIIC